MSFDNTFYIGKHESTLTLINDLYVKSAYLPCGYKIFYNEKIQKGDLYFSLAFGKWRTFPKTDIDLKSNFLARKITNQIFIDI